MSLHAMFSILRRKPLIPLLILVQVTVACAILCNVLFQAWLKLVPMLAPEGVKTEGLLLVDHLENDRRPWSAGQISSVLESIRQIPGVRSASAAYGLPMVSSSQMALTLQGPTGRRISVNGYLGEGLVQTLGLKIVSGRDFDPSDYSPWGLGTDASQGGAKQILPIIITKALQRSLFDDANPIGKILHSNDGGGEQSYIVVGVVRHLLRNRLSLAIDGHSDDTILMANRIGASEVVNFAVRIEPSMLERIRSSIRLAINRNLSSDSSGKMDARISTYAERRNAAFQSNRAVLYLFLSVTTLVTLVTMLGTLGLCEFWVQQRTKQIGIYRALGARRVDILTSFMLENLLIVGFSIVLGMVFAYAVNGMLMTEYELPRLPWNFLPAGAVITLLVSQLAALSSAMRASSVPPIEAVRS